ncbi:MAG: PKD domain-containing protein [Deltaproteobacteria bacterium]|nr:MAG: PKD domain-containing protein [Deltaproteobacteria bacterium]
MTRILAASATVALPLLLVLPGCGGGGGPSEAPTTPTTVAAAKAPTTTTAAAGKGEEEAAPLLAWADGTPEDGPAPLTVEFKSDVEGGTPPLKYTWKFGDDTPDSNEANPKHTYTKPGKYRADLSVTDSAGDSDTDYLEIEVR